MTGNLVSLSEQQLLDCVPAYKGQACGGGDPAVAYRYIISNGGIDTEASYPYTSGSVCIFSESCLLEITILNLIP